MLPSFFAVSAVLLSLTGLSQAVPQSQWQWQSSSTAASSAVLAAATSQAVSPTSTVACNNSPELCNRNYNNITHMGAHDSAFLRDSTTSFSTAGNQFYNVTVALSAGIRLLQAQVHNLNGILELCHTSCQLLDAGPLSTFLSEVKTWMDANTNEVVTILLVNSDNMSAADFGTIFSSSGTSKYGYTPSSTVGPIATWPTLQTLISANTRLVTFIVSINYDVTYPYLLPEFNFVFETAFGVTSLDGFNCTLDRPSTIGTASAATTAGFMGLANHFLDTVLAFGIQVPDTGNLTITNSAATGTTGALAAQGKQCASEWGVKPTFMLVNFFNVGPSMETADQLNGITATGRKLISADPLTQGSDAVRDGAPGWAVWVMMGAFILGYLVCS